MRGAVVAVAGSLAMATVTLLGVAPPADARTAVAPVVVVLDASGSMNTADAPGPRIEAAKGAVASLVRSLPATARVGLLTYGTGTGSAAADRAAGCRDVTVLAPVAPLDRTALLAAVGKVRARGYTPIGFALQRAAAALPADTPGSVVLVSDGEDTCAPPDPCTVARQLADEHRGLVVHTVGFRVDASARRQLQCIAAATGGTYRDADDGASLGPVLRIQVDAGMRPYVVTGTPIEGTPTPADAPTVAPGQYADSFPRGAGAVTKHYAIELATPETFSVAATIVPPALRGGGTGDRLEVSAELLDADGDRCLSSEREHDAVLAGKVDPVTVLLSGAVGGASWSDRCPKQGSFVVAVTRDSASTSATGAEIVVTLEPAVATVPPPVVTVPPGLTAPRVAASGPDCDGGASFDTAPLLSGGTCLDALSTGETRYYRVHLDWGQRLSYAIVVDRVAGAGHGVGQVASAVATPLRQEVTLASTSNASRDFGGPASIRLVGSTLVPVAYGNRTSSRSDIRPYARDGNYYLTLGMSYPIDAVPYSTGVRVSVAVSGTAQPGPDYLDLPATPTTASSPVSSSSVSSSSVPSPSTPAPTTSSAAAASSSGSGGVLVGVLVVLGVAAAGGVYVARSRRAGRAA